MKDYFKINNVKRKINNIYNPLSLSEVINDKYDTVHNILYKQAINKYIAGSLTDKYYMDNNSYSYIVSYVFTYTYNYVNSMVISYNFDNKTIENEFNNIFNNLYSDIYNTTYNTYISYIYKTYLNSKEHINNYYNSYNIIKLKQDDNNLEILNMYKKYPFTKTKIDLSGYWNNIKYYNNNYLLTSKNIDINDLKYKISNEDLSNYYIEYYDYIKEKIQLGNNLNDDKITISFNDLNTKMLPNKYLFYKKYQ